MAMLVDPLLSQSVSELTRIVIIVAQTTANFKPELKQLKSTLDSITQIVDDIVKLNKELDRSEVERRMFIDEIEQAVKLVCKCSKIKRNLFKRFTHSLKLKDVNGRLLRFFQVEVQADQTRDIKRTLLEVHRVSERVNNIDLNMRILSQTMSGSSSMSRSSSRDDHVGSEIGERGKWGWRVPMRPRGIVAFEEPMENLKVKVLADFVNEKDSMDCDDGGTDHNPVVVVAAPGGCGKTTLVTMLCHDRDIKGNFGENIFFVTVSETPNFLYMVNDLINSYSCATEVQFQNEEDAKNKMWNFLYEKVSGPMLLVLDDVWSVSFIDKFPSQMKGCKILVTSRTAFTKYDVFRFDPLSDEDAKKLFYRSAFTGGVSPPSHAIDDDLVNEMVRCCKKHPLTLSVLGKSLNGKDEFVWRSMIKDLSRGRSVLDLHEDVLVGLERSFAALEDEFKQCFLDFGMFPEDQRIPVSAILNMWVHLYDHDDEGIDTLAKICELSYRNLVVLMATGFRKDSGPTVNYCDQQFVTQHDLLRELAIHLNNKQPLAQRTRLNITAQGEYLPASIEQVQKPMQACMLSLSTGESFKSGWCDMNVPNVEVLVLNFMSKTYGLPHFLSEMQKLKILNITNYGLYPTDINNLDLLGCLSNLTRIRLERVVISSLSRPVLELKYLQKVSFIMCKMGNSFENLGSTNYQQVWPGLVEMEIDYCQDLVEFPGMLCNSVHLKKLTVTNCNEMSTLSEEFSNLTGLEMLTLRSCTKLEKLPKTISRVYKLSVLDISDCLSLTELPEEIGNLADLRIIYMQGCSGIHELPVSVAKLSNTQVVCNEEISYQWQEFDKVKIVLVEEDRLQTLMKII